MWGTGAPIELLPTEVARSSDSSFRDLLATLPLDGVARIIDVGAGGFLGETTTIHVLDLLPQARVTAVELDEQRANALQEKFGDRIEVVAGDIDGYSPPEPFDLVIIDLDSQRVPLVFDHLLESALVPITRPGGIIITNIVLDLFNAYHGARPLSSANEPSMCEFMTRSFGHLLLTDAAVKAVFADHVHLHPIVTVDKWRDDPSNYMGWTAFAVLHSTAPERSAPTRDTPASVNDTSDGHDTVVNLLQAGDFLRLDMVGEPTLCAADCPAQMEKWARWARTAFRGTRSAEDLPPEARTSVLGGEHTELDVVVPGEPVALLEIPADIDAYLDRIGPKSRNMIRKAERRGYQYRPFEYNDHLEEIFAINTSKPVRSGGPMEAQYLEHPKPNVARDELCGRHDIVFLGGFLDGELRAYVQLVELVELAVVNQFLGHADSLRDGVMNGLVREMVAHCLAKGHVRAINYLTLASSAEGLARFKRSVGFDPRAVVFQVPKAFGDPIASQNLSAPEVAG